MNDIAFHPVHGTVATVGGDGTFGFWDKDARTKLKSSEPMEQPITRCCFNHNGQIFAYAVSYDWSKVCFLYMVVKLIILIWSYILYHVEDQRTLKIINIHNTFPSFSYFNLYT